MRFAPLELSTKEMKKLLHNTEIENIQVTNIYSDVIGDPEKSIAFLTTSSYIKKPRLNT